MKEKIKTLLLVSIFVFIGNYILLSILPKIIRNIFLLETNMTNKFIVGVTVRIIGLIITLIILKKLKLKLNYKFNFKYSLISWVFIIYIVSNIEFVPIDNKMYFNLALMIIEALSIGFYEEFLFRGLVFNILKEKFKNIIIPISISSILFGLIHFINLKNGYSFNIILYQVIYTTIIGFSMSSILIRTEYSIIWVSLLHGLYDVASGFEKFKVSSNNSGSLDILSVLIGLSYFIPLLIYSLIIIRKRKT